MLRQRFIKINIIFAIYILMTTFLAGCLGGDIGVSQLSGQIDGGSTPLPTAPLPTTAYYAYATKPSYAASGVSATATSGSACLAAPSSTAGIVAGLWVSSNNYSLSGIPRVVAVPGTCPAGQIQLSANATASQADTFNFYLPQITGYLLNKNTSTISSIAGSTLSTERPLLSLVVSTNGKFVYGISHIGGGTEKIEVFEVAPSTGVLTALTSKMTTFTGFGGEVSGSRIVRVNGVDYLYFVDLGNHQVYAYSLSSVDGTLTAVAGSPYFIDGVLSAGYPAPAFGTTIGDGSRYGCGPTDITTNGTYLYLACNNYGSVGGEALAGYSINQSTGALTKLTGSPWATSYGGGANGVAMTPSGSHVYIFNGGNGGWGPAGVDIFSLAGTGIPTMVNTPGTPVTYAGGDISGFFSIIDPTGAFAYIYNAQSSGFSILPLSGNTIGATASFVATASSWGKLKFDADSLFVGASGPAFSVYTRNSTTGALTAFTGSPVAAGAGFDFAFSTVIY